MVLVRVPLEGVVGVGVVHRLQEFVGRLVFEDEVGVGHAEHRQENGEADAEEPHEAEDDQAGDVEALVVRLLVLDPGLDRPPNREGEIQD